jgi:hypothetical protein
MRPDMKDGEVEATFIIVALSEGIHATDSLRDNATMVNVAPCHAS